MSIDTARIDYDSEREFTLHDSPFDLFEEWFQLAARSEIPEPNAMALASVSPSGQPSVRMVLLKGYGQQEGFRFFTNCESRKAEEFRLNPKAAVCFYWDLLHRQVRIVGEVVALSQEEVDSYFRKRPRGAQIAACICKQSSALSSPEELLDRFQKFEADHSAQETLATPAHWGGYALHPKEFEFWQGAKNRLHQRVRYQKQEDADWERQWLFP